MPPSRSRNNHPSSHSTERIPIGVGVEGCQQCHSAILYHFGSNVELMPKHGSRGNAAHFHRGLGEVAAALICTGAIAGIGFLGLPYALINSGVIGILLFIIGVMAYVISSARLTDCCSILREKYYNNSLEMPYCKNPYIMIAHHAFGSFASSLMSVFSQLTLYGIATVHLTSAANISQSLFPHFNPDIVFGVSIIVITTILLPLSKIDSPKKFKSLAVFAVLSTAVACILIITQTLIDFYKDKPFIKVIKHDEFTLEHTILSFSAMLLLHGGASVFPTINADMVNPEKFPKSIGITFAILIGMFTPVVGVSVFVYGTDVKTNILLSLSNTRITQWANVCLMVHQILALIIIINPIYQYLELLLAPQGTYQYKKLATRLQVLLSIAFFATTIPNVGQLVTLFCSATVPILTFVLPSVFLLRLAKINRCRTSLYKITPLPKLIMSIVVAFGVFCTWVFTYAAFTNVKHTFSFVKPNYISLISQFHQD